MLKGKFYNDIRRLRNTLQKIQRMCARKQNYNKHPTTVVCVLAPRPAMGTHHTSAVWEDPKLGNWVGSVTHFQKVSSVPLSY